MADDVSSVIRLRDAAEEQRLLAERWRSGNGGDTPGGVTDDWKASVDRQLEQLHGDFRNLWKQGIAAAVALAVMTGGLYFYFNEKFEAADRRLAAIEARQERIEGKIDTKAAELNGKLDLLLERKSTGK